MCPLADHRLVCADAGDPLAGCFGKKPGSRLSAAVLLTRGSLATESHGLDGPMTPSKTQ